MTWVSDIRSITYLVVDGLVDILNKNVALTRLAEGGVALRPHDTAAKRLISLCNLRDTRNKTNQGRPLIWE